jgi:hypothetical protein
MTEVTAEMAKKTGQKTATTVASRENTALDTCYRQIGISAVAAAVRYQGTAKNPAYGPVAHNWQDLAGDAA